MKRLFFILIFGFTALATSVSAQTVAFTNVNVVPMDRERVLTNQTVVIKNGLITEIGNAKNVKLPKDALRVDGTGKYLIPGLVDMHTHLLSDSDEFPDSIGPEERRVMVANGVTTVRFMIGTPELLTLRSRSAAEKAALVASFESRFGEALAAGRIRPIVDRVFPFDRAADAHRLMESSEHFGKIALRM